MDFHSVAAGLAAVFTFGRLLAMALGVTFGMAIATLPGLSAPLGISLALPIVATMDPATGLIVLGAIWGGAIYGGSKAAVLINTPGNPSSLMTTLDGYPMTLQGRAAQALFGALLASTTGGIISTIILLLAFAPLSAIAVQFGPAQFFWLAILGMTAIGSMTSGNVFKGLLGAGIGVLLALIGMDPVTGTPRFTFGTFELTKGINVIAAILGFFSFAQALRLFASRDPFIAHYTEAPGYLADVFRTYAKRIVLVIRSGLIGTAVGLLPGAGGPVAAMVAYNESRRWDKHPERYGTGALEGVMTAEAAVNATVGGSLIPLMSIGIPGDASAAVIMGGLLTFGLQPGPKLLSDHGLISYTFICSLFVANIFMLLIGFFMMRITGRLLLIPKRFITPSIIALSVIGAFSINNSMIDVYVMIGCGLLAFGLEYLDIHPGTLALGLILASTAESGFAQSLLLAQAKGSLALVLFGQPMSWILIGLIVLAVWTSMRMNRRRVAAAAPVAGEENAVDTGAYL